MQVLLQPQTRNFTKFVMTYYQEESPKSPSDKKKSLACQMSHIVGLEHGSAIHGSFHSFFI
jgi:hypothetical protein